MENKTMIICRTVYAIVAVLIVGEVLGGCVSRPIAAWKGSGINKNNLAEFLASMNNRICELEKEEEAE